MLPPVRHVRVRVLSGLRASVETFPHVVGFPTR